MSGDEPIGLPLVVVFGFLRVGTNAREFKNPMHATDVARHVRSWLSQPPAQILETRPDHMEQVLQILEKAGTAGNLVTGAQIAAIAIEHAAILHTADSDFPRFENLRWFNPITGASSRRLKPN